MKNYWKYIVMSLLGFVVLFHLGAVMYIGDRNYQLTSPDYYTQELEYREIQKRLRAGSNLVWETSQANHLLEISVRDQQGAPVALGNVQLVLYKPNAAELDQTLSVDASSVGAYQLATKDMARGPWTLTLEAEHAGERVAWQTHIYL